MIMGNFMLINAFYGNLFIESGFLLKKNEYPGIYDILKAFTYFLIKGSQRKIPCAKPSDDKIFN